MIILYAKFRVGRGVVRYSIFDMNMWKQQENDEKWRFTLLCDVTIAMERARSEVLTSFLETRDNV